MLRVVECFTSIQGEGPVAGRLSYFIRLVGCNLRCVYCDTKYSWDKDVEPKIEAEQKLVDAIPSEVPLVTITGGEPLLQNLESLVSLLKRQGKEVVIETNGTCPVTSTILAKARLIVSPKLTSSGQRTALRISVDDAWCYKFVILSPQDINEAIQWCAEYAVDLSTTMVYFQPNGLSKNYLSDLRWLMEEVVKRRIDVRVMPQLHRLAWGLRRGV